MTSTEANRIRRRMLLVIPGLILAIIGDYCMGLEPAGSTAISGMISSGWLTIADWRIAVSNIGGMIGTALYTVAALAFLRYLQYKLSECSGKWNRFFLKAYMVGLVWGIMVFMYFHLACGTLIHNFNVIYDAAGGNAELAVQMWKRTYSVQFCRARDHIHRRLDRCRAEGHPAAQKGLDPGCAAGHCVHRVFAGMAAAAALQRLIVGL